MTYPMRDRRPTSHERRARAPWDASYQDGPPPWDLGHPQPAIARLAAGGGFGGAVLDAGCGTGEHALHIAALGLPVLGVDVAETAVAMARDKAASRGLEVEFAVADALELGGLERRFDTVLDCGLFHALDAEERRAYAASLASVTDAGATLHVLCFSDAGPGPLGPHPVGQGELRAAFDRDPGWNVTTIAAERCHTLFAPEGLPAWLATIERI
jgi:SAM-dependent methyltransferase